MITTKHATLIQTLQRGSGDFAFGDYGTATFVMNANVVERAHSQSQHFRCLPLKNSNARRSPRLHDAGKLKMLAHSIQSNVLSVWLHW